MRREVRLRRGPRRYRGFWLESLERRCLLSAVGAPDLLSSSLDLGQPLNIQPFLVEEGFESGSVESLIGWGFDSVNGTIEMTNSNDPRDNWHLWFRGESSSTLDAILHLDLSDQVGVTDQELDFWMQRLEFTDDFATAVGGDGETWQDIQRSLVPHVEDEYRHVTLDLDAAMLAGGIVPDDDVFVRFRSRTARNVTLDDVRVSTLGSLGPYVVSQSPDTAVPGPVSSFEVTFDQAIDATILRTAKTG